MFVSIEPYDHIFNIEIRSTLEYRGEIGQTVFNELIKFNLKNCKMRVVDNGALDFTIRERVHEAIQKFIERHRQES